ncbi:MAG: ArsR/SmtB family transcription factor [Aestuariivirgaceae bacterium]
MTDHVGLLAKLFRGFGDVSRLKVLACLRDGPQSVGMVVARTRLTQPNVSMHLRCLTECGLATRERRGRFVDYALTDKRVVRLLDQAEELLLEVEGRIQACARYEDRARRRGSLPERRRRGVR